MKWFALGCLGGVDYCEAKDFEEAQEKLDNTYVRIIIPEKEAKRMAEEIIKCCKEK